MSYIQNVVISLPTIDIAQLIHSICLRPIRKIPVIENLLSISVTLYFISFFFFVCDSFWNDWWYLKFFNTVGFFGEGNGDSLVKYLAACWQFYTNLHALTLIRTAEPKNWKNCCLTSRVLKHHPPIILPFLNHFIFFALMPKYVCISSTTFSRKRTQYFFEELPCIIFEWICSYLSLAIRI